MSIKCKYIVALLISYSILATPLKRFCDFELRDNIFEDINKRIDKHALEINQIHDYSTNILDTYVSINIYKKSTSQYERESRYLKILRYDRLDHLIKDMKVSEATMKKNSTDGTSWYILKYEKESNKKYIGYYVAEGNKNCTLGFFFKTNTQSKAIAILERLKYNFEVKQKNKIKKKREPTLLSKAILSIEKFLTYKLYTYGARDEGKASVISLRSPSSLKKD